MNELYGHRALFPRPSREWVEPGLMSRSVCRSVSIAGRTEVLCLRISRYLWCLSALSGRWGQAALCGLKCLTLLSGRQLRYSVMEVSSERGLAWRHWNGAGWTSPIGGGDRRVVLLGTTVLPDPRQDASEVRDAASGRCGGVQPSRPRSALTATRAPSSIWSASAFAERSVGGPGRRAAGKARPGQGDR